MNDLSPKLLCKFKPFNCKSDFDFTIDIIENNRFYMSNINQLNDVFECPITGLSISIAGSGLHSSQGQLHPKVDSILNEYRILAQTSDYLNEVMWAHYANNFNGACIVVRNHSKFNESKKVEYRINQVNAENVENNLNEIIFDSLFIKNPGWSYEKEYRLVKKESEDNYLYFDASEIKCIIIGHKTDLKSQDFQRLKGVIEKYKISMYKTYINRYEGRIMLVKMNYEPNGEGSMIDEIII